jgi:hypothetical protein
MTIQNKLFINKSLLFILRVLDILNTFMGIISIYFVVLIIRYLSNFFFNLFHYKVPYDLPLWLFCIWTISFILLMIPFIKLSEMVRDKISSWVCIMKSKVIDLEKDIKRL